MVFDIDEITILIGGVIENFRSITVDKIPLWKNQQIQLSLKKLNATLLENRNKIWLRTKDGRSLLNKIEASIRRLKSLSESLKEEKRPEMIKRKTDSVHEYLKDIDETTKTLMDEIQRRSMSIT